MLSEYLTWRETEVEGIMLILFDQDWVTTMDQNNGASKKIFTLENLGGIIYTP